MADPISERINGLVTSNDVVLFMKGIPAAPQCGFSAAVVQVLSQIGVPFKSFNVLADPELREGIKAYSNWPTVPQLYIKGEFIGGADIVREMFSTGELTALLAATDSPAIAH
ncbi:MAG: Grx4 family monothiol glutaredoxin [Beijerinckiaceae bacterium]|jgi:monothiol glutaredoxin